MRFFLVDRIVSVSDTARVGSSHGVMFHGEELPSRFEFRDPANPTRPMTLARPGRWVPDVADPATLVVREHVREKLLGMPNIAFQPVRWAKLIDLPHYAPGDYSFKEDPLFIKYGGRWEQKLDTLYERAPDVPALHEDFPPCHEMLVYARRKVGGVYHLRKQALAIPHSATEEVELSPQLLRDYPILADAGYIFSEAVFPLIDPHIDRDFFVVVEGEA